MAADVLVLRSTRERETSEAVRRKVAADLERIQKVAYDIREMSRMTRLYRERLEGKRVE